MQGEAAQSRRSNRTIGRHGRWRQTLHSRQALLLLGQFLATSRVANPAPHNLFLLRASRDLALALGLEVRRVAPAVLLPVANFAQIGHGVFGRSSFSLLLSLPFTRNLPYQKASSSWAPRTDKSMGCGVAQEAGCARLTLSISAFSASHVVRRAVLRTKCCSNSPSGSSCSRPALRVNAVRCVRPELSMPPGPLVRQLSPLV